MAMAEILDYRQATGEEKIIFCFLEMVQICIDIENQNENN
jgi:hypothetical protein